MPSGQTNGGAAPSSRGWERRTSFGMSRDPRHDSPCRKGPGWRSSERGPPDLRRAAGGDRTSRGNQAHGRSERSAAGNGAGSQRTRSWRKALEPACDRSTTWGSAQADRSFVGRIAGNGTRATAAVTRCGCERGELFEGCEPRRGERPGRPDSSFGSASRGARRRETRRTPRSAAGCNKPATVVRRKPSRWCETTRTEREVGGWLHRPDRDLRIPWSGRTAGTSAKGRSDEPQERQGSTSVSADPRGSASADARDPG
jgi:hypothetical protein